MDRRWRLRVCTCADHAGVTTVTDQYHTLSGPGEGLLRMKASKFLGFPFHIQDNVEFEEKRTAIPRDNYTSRQVCSAWVIGERGDHVRANDAGEPSGTAGRPILHHIQGAHLTYTAVVVVRYFGGTLLGKDGLVQA